MSLVSEHVSVKFTGADLGSRRCELENRVTCTHQTNNQSSALKKVPYPYSRIVCTDWKRIIRSDSDGDMVAYDAAER